MKESDCAYYLSEAPFAYTSLFKYLGLVLIDTPKQQGLFRSFSSNRRLGCIYRQTPLFVRQRAYINLRIALSSQWDFSQSYSAIS